MITRLYIRNYGIIREHEIKFHSGLTVITGETGAGKSILLGAMGLLTGDRSDVTVLYDKNEKCVCEADFESYSHELSTWLEEEGFENIAPLVIRREIMPNGKSRAFINDSPANLQQVKTVGSWLMDISGQQESREINTSRFQFDFIDELSGSKHLSEKQAKDYWLLHQLIGRLNALREQELQRSQQLELENYQLAELDSAQLVQTDELSMLEQQLEIQENALYIRQLLEQLNHQLHEQENAVISQLQSMANMLSSYKKLSPEIAHIHTTLHNSQLELSEMSRDLGRVADAFETDEEKLSIIKSRIDQLNRLLGKHRLIDISQLIEKREKLRISVESLNREFSESNNLEFEIQQKQEQLLKQAITLSKQRHAVLADIHQKLAALLPAVGLPHASIKLELREANEIVGARQGINELRLLFSANKGSEPAELHKVASGGELSRVMLCLKSMLHTRAQLPTVVFDEIDTGISGETALQVGKVLRQLANAHQVILITHLPQIAAIGNQHLFITKKTENNRTLSEVHLLENEAREAAIARMIAGEKAGQTAIQQAKELLYP